MKTKKKILPLMASISLLGGPVLLLTACDNERDMNNLPNGKIPDQYKNRVLFNFFGVNYNRTVSDQFKDTYNQGLDFILKDVEGTIAKQKFYEFFHNTLHYSADTLLADGTYKIGQANAAFEKLKDDLGLSLLTKAYLAGLKSTSLDKTSSDKGELLFQNQSWHQNGTSKFDYANTPFYKEAENNPDTVFSPGNLYKDYNSNNPKGNAEFDAKLAKIAKHADDHYSDDISSLLGGKTKTWSSSAGLDQTQKSFDNNDIPTYQEYLKRFQWWLRFRYQQYYQYEILPQLNNTLFTMSYILSNLFSIKDDKQGNPNIETLMNNTYISQLQDTTNFANSNYNTSWNFTTSLANARIIDKNWNDSKANPWTSITKSVGGNTTLNTSFFSQMNTGASPSISNIDPNFGINGFTSNATNTPDNASWINYDGLHYTTNNSKTIATFTYTTPIYFLNLIQNLDFGYLMNNNSNKNWIPTINNLIHSWINSKNNSLNTDFSKYIRGNSGESDIGQQQKWNIFWQMLYSISASDSTDKKSPAATNFKNAADNLFPTYIPKNNIYEEGFWNKVKEYYP